MIDVFGTKELYDITLKATLPMRIGEFTFEEDETILHFDTIEIATLDTVTSRVAATGGFDNRPHVIWEHTRQLNYTMKKGVLSRSSWALISNSQLLPTEEMEPVQLCYREVLETDDNGVITLKYKPFKLFLYDDKTNKKITDYTLNGNIVDTNLPFTTLVADYRFKYIEERETLYIGKKLLQGYLSLEGKIEIKDDKDGLEKTGILKIPKLLLASDLSIRLGLNAQPMVGNFEMIGFPVGSRGDSSVCSITFLEENLRSDI